MLRIRSLLLTMVMLALLGGGIWLLYPERDPLYTDLRSKSYKTRYAAAQQLGVKGAVSAVPHLTARIDDPYENLGIKTAAIKSLGQIGGLSAFSAIKDALENLELDPSVRAMAPTAFGIMQDRRSIEPMLQALSSQDDIMIQHNLLHSLHKFSGPEVDDGLRAFLESDHDSTIQAVALDMYAQMDRRKAAAHVVRRLETIDDPDLQNIYIEVAGKLEAKGAIPTLITFLGQSSDRRVQRAAILALGRMKAEAAIPIILPLLETYPMSAVTAFYQIGSPEPADALVAYFSKIDEARLAHQPQDPADQAVETVDSDVRLMMGSRRYGQQQQQDPSADELFYQQNGQKRIAVLRTIASIAPAKGYDLFVKIAKTPADSHDEISLAIHTTAIDALGLTKNPATVDVIIDNGLLQDDASAIVGSALVALSRFTSDRARDAIMHTAETNPNPEIQELAKRLLEN